MYLIMHHFAILLYLMSRVNSAVTVRRHIYSHQISRLSQSDSQPSITGRSYSKFDGSPRMFDTFANSHTEHSNYAVKDAIESKTAEKLRNDLPYYSDLTGFPEMVTESYIPYSFTPVSTYIADHKISRNIVTTDVDRPKYPRELKSDIFYGYDFQNDDEDVRTSGRNSYDNYAPFLYQTPYEYEHREIVMDKAKDKRYAIMSKGVIPVHENIENDTFIGTPMYEASTIPTDNPIGGHGPFFSFVLNDYFDRNHDEDTLTFRGIGADWGKDFDDNYRPAVGTISNRQLENKYYTPVAQWVTTRRPDKTVHYINTNGVSIAPQEHRTVLEQSVTENGLNKLHKFDNHDLGKTQHSVYKKSDAAGEQKYEGFKDFVDSFANKFGSEGKKGDSNSMHEINKDKGEKKKRFHRVYHKDEFLEDNEFYDNSNSSTKAAEKASSNFNIGGSEAILRSQALAAERNAANANSEFGNANGEQYGNAHSGLSDFNTHNNKFDTYIDVAKQTARSNNADYVDHYKLGKGLDPKYL